MGVKYLGGYDITVTFSYPQSVFAAPLSSGSQRRTHLTKGRSLLLEEVVPETTTQKLY